MRIAFLVTHLLGTGHLARASRIADAFAAAGHEAVVLSGGMPAPLAAPKTARLHQLPPVRSDAAFKTLFDGQGTVANAAYLEQRIAAIHTTLRDFRPDVLVTEQFPFGRRKLAAEFRAAVTASRDAGALVLSSIRDILQVPEKPGRREDAEAWLAELYDGLLFHGDSSLVKLEESWALPAALRGHVWETGYIGEDPVDPGDGAEGRDEILVAAGGGATGDPLFRASVAAAARSDRQWRLMVGGQERIAALGPLPPNVRADPLRPDFRTLLARCRVAVLQCGYNTAMDVVASGARVVFCPFEGELETEQAQRATAMAARYGCGIVREKALDGAALVKAVEAMIPTPPPDYSGLQLDGATRCIALIEQALADRA